MVLVRLVLSCLLGIVDWVGGAGDFIIAVAVAVCCGFVAVAVGIMTYITVKLQENQPRADAVLEHRAQHVLHSGCVKTRVAFAQRSQSIAYLFLSLQSSAEWATPRSCLESCATAPSDSTALNSKLRSWWTAHEMSVQSGTPAFTNQ